VIKEWVARPRPCHLVHGEQVVQGLHLLVNCGGGKSFPSSHAVNNFAVATVFSRYYRRGSWAFFSWAALIGLSRAFVGVHFPSDILGGALIGTGVGAAIAAGWTWLSRRYFPGLAVDPAPCDKAI
jgi:undecaprenyl-diphosphatase